MVRKRGFTLIELLVASLDKTRLVVIAGATRTEQLKEVSSVTLTLGKQKSSQAH